MAAVDPAALGEGVLAGNRRAVARAITLVESMRPDRREPAKELLRRIAKRGRPYEQEMKPEYLAELTARYDDYFRTYAHPHLIIEAEGYDFVTNEADERAIFAQIDAALAAAPTRKP